MRVAWFALESSGAPVRPHQTGDWVTRAIARLLRANLVVVDDIGMLRVGADAAEGFYWLVDAAHQRRSVAVASNLHPAGGTSSCRRLWRRRPWTGSYTTRTS
jgi:hypothetical protein